AVDISFAPAALGASVEVPTIEGPDDLEIPPGTQPHDTLTLRGRGMPSLRGRRHGDLRVVVNVITPRHLSHEQRELLGQFADTLTPENLGTEEEGVFHKLRRALRG
ncbi:MAG TPA: DnaJ C-terminal domain-containing protein, partial [Solirubrobacteraceae bacterium]|nr:DnaJ C-terminal domain-containing protein [Solirubrobacteraceae bacterium]